MENMNNNNNNNKSLFLKRMALRALKNMSKCVTDCKMQEPRKRSPKTHNNYYHFLDFAFYPPPDYPPLSKSPDRNIHIRQDLKESRRFVVWTLDVKQAVLLLT